MESPNRPNRVNSGTYNPSAPSALDSILLSPEQVEAVLERGETMPADTMVAVAGKEYSIFSYLINLMQVSTLVMEASKRPLPAWLQHRRDNDGKYPLHWAVILPGFSDDARVDLVGALLDSQADPNCQDNDTFGLRIAGAKNTDLASKCGGKSPLHHLCGSMRESVQTKRAIELFLRHKAEPNLEDFDGNTPLMLAQMRRNDVSAILLGGSALSDAEANQLLTAYERTCTEREGSWERQRQEAKVQARCAYVARLTSEYQPRHPKLYALDMHESFFEPSFLQALQVGTRDAFEKIRDFKELSPGLYQYRIFREEVCYQLMEEVDSFNAFAAASDIQVTRPNSMNRFGLILNDIGFLRAMDVLMRRFIQPLAAAFFSERLGGECDLLQFSSYLHR